MTVAADGARAQAISAPAVQQVAPTWTISGYADTAADIVATGPRTVYTTGMVKGNLHVAKFVDGLLRWQKTYNGPYNGVDGGVTIAVRGSAVYTAGFRQQTRDSGDLVLIRWDSAGNRVWTRTYGLAKGMDDTARDVAVDALGNVVVICRSHTRTTGADWTLLSYKPNGDRRYVRRFDGAAHLDDTPHKLWIDSSRNVYVVGQSDSLKGGCDALVAKYSAAGTRLWTNRYNGTANNVDQALALRARPGGGIYAAGFSDRVGTGYDGLLLAYTAAGKRLYATTDAGPDASLSSSQVFNDLVVLANGDVVCGGSDYPDTVDRYYAVFRSSGSVRSRVAEVAAFNEEIWKMAKDAQGNVYMTGPAGTATGTQILTRRLHAGSIDWESAWPEVPALDAEPRAIAIGGLNLFVAGNNGKQVVLGYVN